MCCGGQGTAGQVDMVGGAQDEHTLPGKVNDTAISVRMCGRGTYTLEGSICLYACPAHGPL